MVRRLLLLSFCQREMDKTIQRTLFTETKHETTLSAPPKWHYVHCGDPAVRSSMSPKPWAHNPCGIFDATKASMGPHFPRSASGGLFNARPCQNKHLHTQFKHEDALIFALRGRRKLVCVPSTFETIQSVLYIQEFNCAFQ